MAPPRFTCFAPAAARAAAARCAVVGLCLAASCQRAGAPLGRERDDIGLPGAEDTAAPPTADETAAFVGPPRPEPGDQSAASAEAPPAEAPAATTEADAPLRADGRPAWWLDAASRDAGRVSVTAEALGGNARDARAAALESARASLAREIGAAPIDFRVEAYLARPLASDAPGLTRVVGYVRVSARE